MGRKSKKNSIWRTECLYGLPRRKSSLIAIRTLLLVSEILVCYNDVKMEMTKDESKRILRRIELEAYSALVTALRAQGELDREKKRLLRELGEQLSISTERHRAEIRRAISDDRLSMIAECVCGSDACIEWESEGRRVVPLMPRLVPQTVFTGTATAAANHAASVNAAISSSAKAKIKDKDDDDMKTRKRQRTTSPKPVQKVIVSSIPKTTAQRNTVSTVTSPVRGVNGKSEETARFVKTSTIPTKQEISNSPLSSASMKISSSRSGTSGHQVSSKPLILGGVKQPSSVSVATSSSKHVAPLPASCLQAHASVVSGNKNRTKLNFVKQKPKPKFKTLTAAVKIKPVPSKSQGTDCVSQSLSSAEKNKGVEVSTPVAQTTQVPRSTASITVSPRNSISLTTFKNSLQQKPKSQSPPGIVRTFETTSRHPSGQLSKAATVPRLSRPLPAILPKAIPGKKSISAVAPTGRKLASILPAPTKSATSTKSGPVMLPVVASSVTSTTSSPIPIAPLPRPSQSFHGLPSTVLNKVPAVSLTAGPSSAIKRDNRETCSTFNPPVPISSSASISEVAKVESRNSVPSVSTVAQESIHERETLSPVSDILTLVTSSSSVPFVSSSTVKSKPLAKGGGLSEISLKCEEKLSEVKEFLKEDEIELKELKAFFSVCPANPKNLSQNIPKYTANDLIKTVKKSNHDTQDQNLGSSVKAAETDTFLEKAKEPSTSTIQSAEQAGESVHKKNKMEYSGIDLSPLVNELLCSTPVITNENSSEKSVDISGSHCADTATPGAILDGMATDKDIVKCTGVDSTLLALQEDLRVHVGNSDCPPDLDQERVEGKSDNNSEDIVSSTAKEIKVIDQTAMATKHIKGLGETNSIEKQKEMEAAKADVVQVETSAELKDEDVLDVLPVMEKEKRVEVDKFTQLKERETKQLMAKAKERAEKLRESHLVIDERKSQNCVVNTNKDMENLDEVGPSNSEIKPEQSEVIAAEKIDESNQTNSVKYQKETELLVVTTAQSLENLGENRSLRQKKTEQFPVTATKQVEKLSKNATLDNMTETENLELQTTKSMEQRQGNCSTAYEKDEDKVSVETIKNVQSIDEASEAIINESEKQQSDSLTLSHSSSSTMSVMSESCATEDKVESLAGNETGSRIDSGEELPSGSETGSTESTIVRTSGRKRKAPPPRDLTLTAHPPGWIRGALLLLQRVSRFRGNARLKGEPSAASWFTKPVEAADAPGYHKIIKNPMDFGTIKSKLEDFFYTVNWGALFDAARLAGLSEHALLFGWS